MPRRLCTHAGVRRPRRAHRCSWSRRMLPAPLVSRRNSLFRGRRHGDPRLPRVRKRCRTTSSRRTPTSSRSACARWRLPALERGIVIVDLPTALQRLPPRTFVDGHALSLKAGEALDLEKFRLRLTSAGYASVPQVAEPGDFAIRGSLFDVSPMGSDAPLRIDLFDDVIDSIRSFDAETQRSLEKLPRSTRCLRASSASRPSRSRTSGGASARVSRVTHAHAALSRRGRRPRARRDRVLPAAVFREHDHAVRLPAGAHDGCCCRPTTTRH